MPLEAGGSNSPNGNRVRPSLVREIRMDPDIAKTNRVVFLVLTAVLTVLSFGASVN